MTDFTTALNEVKSILSKQSSDIKNLNDNHKMVLELLNTNYQILNDINTKLDFYSNVEKIPKPVPVESQETSKTTKVPKKEVKQKTTSKHINHYFKNMYAKDNNYFNDIFEEKQIEALFIEHKDILDKKKGTAKITAQSNILYESLSKTQKKKLRDKKDSDNTLDNDTTTDSNNQKDDIKCENSD